MTDEPVNTAPDVETPAAPMLTTNATSSSVPAEDLGDWMADQMAERSKILAANEADNGMRALHGPDYADKAAN